MSRLFNLEKTMICEIDATRRCKLNRNEKPKILSFYKVLHLAILKMKRHGLFGKACGTGQLVLGC